MGKKRRSESERHDHNHVQSTGERPSRPRASRCTEVSQASSPAHSSSRKTRLGKTLAQRSVRSAFIDVDPPPTRLASGSHHHHAGPDTRHREGEMTLMDQTQGSDMERLWALLSELSAQLSHNRQQTEELHRRADELKVRARGGGAGQPYRQRGTDPLHARRLRQCTLRPGSRCDDSTSTSAKVTRLPVLFRPLWPGPWLRPVHEVANLLWPCGYCRGVRVGARAAQRPTRDGESGVAAREPATVESAQGL